MAEQDSYAEARRRVEEMQRRSRGYLMQNPRAFEESEASRRHPHMEPPPPPTENPSGEGFTPPPAESPPLLHSHNQEHFSLPPCPPPGDFPPKKGFLGGLLDTLLPGLAVDEERLLLLLLLIILAKNGSDIKLLLALGYLLL